jgi:hypothetical protein
VNVYLFHRLSLARLTRRVNVILCILD